MRFIPALIAAVTSASPLSAAERLTLARDGESPYAIVIAADASPSTVYAAEELQRFLGEIAGASLPVVRDDGAPPEHAILLGDSAHLRSVAPDLDLAPLGHEGYVLRTVDSHLVIA